MKKRVVVNSRPLRELLERVEVLEATQAQMDDKCRARWQETVQKMDDAKVDLSRAMEYLKRSFEKLGRFNGQKGQ